MWIEMNCSIKFIQQIGAFIIMDIIRFKSTFKPSGPSYVKISLWNRYIRSKIILITSFIPTIVALYFILQDKGSPFFWVFFILLFYPVYSLIAFLLKIKKHLIYRSPLDTAVTDFTFMNNGILVERENAERPELYHWTEYTLLYELKDFMLLYKGEMLGLVFDKRDMDAEQLPLIRKYILKHLPKEHAYSYKKSIFF